MAVVHWHCTTDGQLTGQALAGEFNSEQQVSLIRLAGDCFSQQKPMCKIVPGASHQQAMAVPVDSGELGVLTALFSPSAPPESTQRTRTQQLELVATHVHLQNASQPLAADDHTAQPTIWRLFRDWCWSLRKNSKAYAMVASVILLVGICPWPHWIKCQVTCEPATRRFVSTPFESKLLDVKVHPGDQVTAGQLLARLDGSDLRAQIASLQAKHDQAVQRRSAALSAVDAAQVAIERLEVEHLSSEIALLKDRQRRLEIRSPVAGMVISGDLERASGATLSVGENLFEIAPLDRMVAEIAIPEGDISFIEASQEVCIRVDARSSNQLKTRLARIHPRSEILDNASVFVGEAELENNDHSLRPGMHGTAWIRAGTRPIGWQLFHKPFDALRAVIGW